MLKCVNIKGKIYTELKRLVTRWCHTYQKLKKNTPITIKSITIHTNSKSNFTFAFPSEKKVRSTLSHKIFNPPTIKSSTHLHTKYTHTINPKIKTSPADVLHLKKYNNFTKRIQRESERHVHAAPTNQPNMWPRATHLPSGNQTTPYLQLTLKTATSTMKNQPENTENRLFSPQHGVN